MDAVVLSTTCVAYDPYECMTFVDELTAGPDLVGCYATDLQRMIWP